MLKIIPVALLGAILSLAEIHYQEAITYTSNVAESDADIVVAMSDYYFELDHATDDITEADKVTAYFKSLTDEQ